MSLELIEALVRRQVYRELQNTDAEISGETSMGNVRGKMAEAIPQYGHR